MVKSKTSVAQHVGAFQPQVSRGTKGSLPPLPVLAPAELKKYKNGHKLNEAGAKLVEYLKSIGHSPGSVAKHFKVTRTAIKARYASLRKKSMNLPPSPKKTPPNMKRTPYLLKRVRKALSDSQKENHVLSANELHRKLNTRASLSTVRRILTDHFPAKARRGRRRSP
jgi:hypothetical protein